MSLKKNLLGKLDIMFLQSGKTMQPELLNNKARILEQAADYIEQNPDQYNWGDMTSCNCGFIAQVIMGENYDSFYDYFYNSLSEWKIHNEDSELCFNGSWKNIKWDVEYCDQTGLPIPEVIKAIINAGFTLDELEEFEDLTDCSIKKVINFSYRSDPATVVSYFREKAYRIRQEVLSMQSSKLQQYNTIPVRETIS